MKSISMGMFALALLALGTSAVSNAGSIGTVMMNESGVAVIATKPAAKIEIREGDVMGLSFAPSGRYLAILVSGTSDAIVVWDVVRDRRVCEITDLGGIHFKETNARLQWTSRGWMSFGLSTGKQPIYFWNPETGEVEKSVSNVAGLPLNLDRAGARAATVLPPSKDTLHRVRIYDTASWAPTEFPTYPIQPHAVAWTSEDALLVVGGWTPDARSAGQDEQPKSAFHINDEVAQLFDGNGKAISNPVLVSRAREIPSGNGARVYYVSSMLAPYFAISDAKRDLFAYGVGKLIRVAPLGVISYDDSFGSATQPNAGASANLSLSPDGRRLFWTSAAKSDDVQKNIVLDTSTGKIIGSFAGGHWGIAIGPDGKLIALGKKSSVELLTIP